MEPLSPSIIPIKNGAQISKSSLLSYTFDFKACTYSAAILTIRLKDVAQKKARSLLIRRYSTSWHAEPSTSSFFFKKFSASSNEGHLSFYGIATTMEYCAKCRMKRSLQGWVFHNFWRLCVKQDFQLHIIGRLLRKHFYLIFKHWRRQDYRALPSAWSLLEKRNVVYVEINRGAPWNRYEGRKGCLLKVCRRIGDHQHSLAPGGASNFELQLYIRTMPISSMYAA